MSVNRVAVLTAAAMWIASGVLVTAAGAQIPEPNKTVAIVTTADIQDLNDIISKEVPQRWVKPIAEWLNKLIARQTAAENAAQAKTAPESNPAQQKK